MTTRDSTREDTVAFDLSALTLRDPRLAGRLIDRRIIDLFARQNVPDLVATWLKTPHAGSHNVTVTVTGTSARGNRFTRTTTRTVRVR